MDDRSRIGESWIECSGAVDEKRGNLFLAPVDKVVVGDGLRFIMRDGTEWEA